MASKYSFLLGIGLLLNCAVARAELLEVPVENLIAPSQGYEVKNNIQVVLYGALPNACYSLGEVRVEQNLSNKTVMVRQFAFHEVTGMCSDESSLPSHMRIAIPFANEVSIGQLREGTFTFFFNKGKEGVGSRQLSVAPNVSPRVDTLPYAAVSNMSISDVVKEQNELEVTLQGVLTSTCTVLNDEVKVLKQNDVFVVMPTVKVKPGVLCGDALIPFEKKVKLGRVELGRYLIHTRSMNGKSINRVILVVRDGSIRNASY